jgi:hypothetical protein
VRPEQISYDLFHCVPLPDWVDHQPYRADLPDTEDSCVAGGIRRLLNDVQVNLCLPVQAWHCRTVQRVLTREGAQRLAHVVVEFDPGYQRAEVHFVRVVRDGNAIEHAKLEAFQLLRRETNLERLIFDGVLTASLLIPDVRINDVVEIGVTIHGSVPILSGRYVAWAVFDSFNPWFEGRQRLLKPRSRYLAVKEYNNPPERTVTTAAETEDLRWQIIGQKRREPEALTPSWLIQHPCLQSSEFENWNEVACLLAPHYSKDVLPEALADEVDRLAIAHKDPAERAVEWLRFVQRELRYFAFSLGEGGLTPRTLDSIWSTRFGDCKDAATLYAAGARRLGLKACPALVSTTHGFALEDFIPSSGVFNHCIVRLSLDGNQYWLDPTMSVQSGTLHNVFQPHVGWALPLTQQTAALEKLDGEAPLHILHWEEELHFGPKPESPAQFRRHIDYFFWAADMLHNRIANDGAGEQAKAMFKELQSVWPGVVETAPIVVRDDKMRNCVTLILSYEIPNCWKQADDGKRLTFSITDAALGGELTPFKGLPRQAEIYLGRPRKATYYARMNMPCRWAGNGWWDEYEAPGVRYINRFKIDGRTIGNSKDLVISKWSVHAAHADAYNEVASKLSENLLNVWARERFGKVRPVVAGLRRMGSKLGDGINAAWLFIVIVWILLPLLKILASR